MTTEQITTPDTGSETPKDAEEVFTEILEAEESAENQEVETTEPELTEEVEEETEVEEESEEDEPETTDEEEETEDDDDVEVEERKTFRVKANGKETDVTLDELVSGYQKGEDYTQKSQALAEQRKAVEAEAHMINEATQLREQYAQRLNQVQQLIEQENNDGVDMDQLRENDPIAWSIQVATKTENNKKLQLLAQEQDRLAQAQQQQTAQHQAKMVAHEAKMLSEKVMEFSNPKKAELNEI
jgi:hypothetical protein